jgi:hypothetical protein
MSSSTVDIKIGRVIIPLNRNHLRMKVLQHLFSKQTGASSAADIYLERVRDGAVDLPNPGSDLFKEASESKGDIWAIKVFGDAQDDAGKLLCFCMLTC